MSAIEELLSRAVASGDVPGAVAVIADRDGMRETVALGWRDAQARDPMRADDVFRIASLTKAVASISAMQLVESGLLDLDAPVGDLLPEFNDVQVLDGFDGDRPLLRAPARRATVRNLLTQTSGLVYDCFSADHLHYTDVTGVPMAGSGLASSFNTPLATDPGTRFLYGMSTDWTGRVIEKVTGRRLSDYFFSEVFAPLGLQRIDFEIRPAWADRLVPAHVRNEQGAWVRSGFEWNEHAEFDSAGHGLYGSALDFMQIQRMLLRGGEVDGHRFLQSETVRRMFTNQIGDLRIGTLRSVRPELSEDLELGAAKWGFDFLLHPDGVPGGRGPGSAGWCGTFNSFYWIDPGANLTAALHLQTLPLYDPPVLALAESFEAAVYRPQ